MNILIAGSSGFIGTALSTYFKQQGHIVRRLVRKTGGVAHDEVSWDPETGQIDIASLENTDVWINLAGEGVSSGRWNEKKKKKILDSRVKSTQLLSKAIKELKNPPSVWVNASAIGYYGDRGDVLLDEQSTPGTNFLAQVCTEWEKAVQAPSSTRTVFTRFGMVLSPDGGALKQMLLPFKLGTGGVIGSGTQYVSWITLQDLVEGIAFVIKNSALKGPVNFVTPYSVTNQELTTTLGKVLNRPTFVSMPAFAARLVFGEMADELLLSSQRVEPKKLTQAGFSYTYPHLEAALKALVA